MRDIIRVSVFVCLLFVSGNYQSSAQEKVKELQGLIDAALDKSAAIKINNLSIEQTQIDRKLAKNIFVPKFTLNGTYTRLNDDVSFDNNLVSLLKGTEKLLIKEAIGVPFNTPFPAGIPTSEIPPLLDKNVLKASLDMDWVLFSGFKVSNAVKATKHKEKAQEYASLTAKTSVVMAVSDAYYKLGLVQASKKVLQSSENYLNTQEKFVKSAIKNGLAIPIDRQKITLAKHRLEVKRLDINNKEALVLALLHQLTNLPLMELAQLQPQLSVLTADDQRSTKKRSEILALEEVILATGYQQKIEQNEFIPKIAAKGHYEFIEDDLSLLDPKWYIGVGIKWSVFDGFKTQNKAKKIAKNKLKYEAQLTEATSLIELNETKARLSLQTVNQKIVMIQQEVVLATKMYHFVNKQYKNGLTGITDLMDALNDVEKSNFKLQTAFYMQQKARLEYLQAKGLIY
ncbi:MAG: transporter [Flavobacteriaceae bacterium]|nr:MAG: transporter [Flavobacteriaceae bacterium]